MSTDTTERGLERLICMEMTGSPCDPATLSAGDVREGGLLYGKDWIPGLHEDYDRDRSRARNSSPSAAASRISPSTATPSARGTCGGSSPRGRRSSSRT